jgi:hypothetical protein
VSFASESLGEIKMTISRFTGTAYLSAVMLFLGSAAGEAWAQKGPFRACQGEKPGTCVEFTVRYYKDPQHGNGHAPVQSPKIVVMEGTNKAKPMCNEKSCKAFQKGAKETDSSMLNFKQTTTNPYCYVVCNDGWCWEECF